MCVEVSLARNEPSVRGGQSLTKTIGIKVWEFLSQNLRNRFLYSNLGDCARQTPIQNWNNKTKNLAVSSKYGGVFLPGNNKKNTVQKMTKPQTDIIAVSYIVPVTINTIPAINTCHRSKL